MQPSRQIHGTPAGLQQGKGVPPKQTAPTTVVNIQVVVQPVVGPNAAPAAQGSRKLYSAPAGLADQPPAMVGPNMGQPAPGSRQLYSAPAGLAGQPGYVDRGNGPILPKVVPTVPRPVQPNPGSRQVFEKPYGQY